MIGGVVDDDDSGMVVGERRMPLGEETSRGPDDRLDSNILAMRFSAGKDRRSPCGMRCRCVKLAQAQRRRYSRRSVREARIGREEGKGQGEESVSFESAERWLDRRDWGCGLQRQDSDSIERRRGKETGR